MVGKSFLFGDIGAVRIGEGGQLYWRMYRFIIIIIIFIFFSEEKESPRIA